MTKDYSGQNLRGRSFKGQNLEGANFGYADIRGADFTGANLRGANFTGAKTGLQHHWIVSLVIFSCFLATLAGFALTLASIGVSANLVTSFFIVRNVIILTILLVFFTVNIQRGIPASFITLALIFGATAALAIVISIFSNLRDVIAFCLGVIGSLLVTSTLSATTAGAIAVAGLMTVIGIIAATGIGIGIGIIFTASEITLLGIVDSIVNVIASVLGIVQGVYIVNQALIGKEKFAPIRPVAIAFASIGGTSFECANLSDTDFTESTLKSTDLRGADLTRTCWFHAKQLDRARVGNSYLKYPQVQQLVTTRQGQDQNFNGLHLEGINLKGANLTDASLISTNLNQSNLQDADLSRAKLKQTQLDGADLTGVCLTGAYIEDWGITNGTKFDGARCEYVYMRLPTKENPDPCRKPDNREEVFKDGDFADFIQPIFDTLDLYHNQGVDPRAIAIAFKQLAENNPEADLRIVGMEVRGEDKFLLRAKTAATADKSELSAEYFDTSNHLKACDSLLNGAT